MTGARAKYLHVRRNALVVDKALVEKIAGLAKLKFNESEMKTLAIQLSSILEHMEVLDSIKVDGVTPMFHGCVEEYELSEDKVDVFDPEPIRTTTPYIKDDFFCVPSILEGEN